MQIARTPARPAPSSTVPLVLAGLLATLTAERPSAQEDPVGAFREVASLDTLRALESHVQDLLARVRPAVVDLGGATGVIVADDLILTAGHVNESIGDEVVILLHDGREIRGRTLGRHSETDSGLIRITTEGEYPKVEMAETGRLERGSWCLMLGHPGGALPGRPAPARLGRMLEPDDGGYLVTDCPMQGGDSGGPLFDLDGRVIGINSNIRRELSVNRHVPIDAFRADWERLLAGETLGRSARGSQARPRFLFGMILETDQDRRDRIQEVAEDSSAATGGLLPGDRILAIGDEPFRGSRFQLVKAARKNEGGTLRLKIEREPLEGEGPPEVLEIDMPVGDDMYRTPARRDRMAQGPSGRRLRRIPSDFSLRAQESFLTTFQPVSGEADRSVVGFWRGDRRVALGTIVREDGLVLTKASEVEEEDGSPLTCEFAGRPLGFSRVAVDETLDLALIQLEGDADFAAPRWADAPPREGTWLVSPDGEAAPEAVGIVSCDAYVRPDRYARLGVRLEENRITELTEGEAAQGAGLQVGDVVVGFDGIAVADRDQLIRRLRTTLPREEVALSVRRGAEELQIRLALGRSDLAPPSPQRRYWGPLSERAREFGEVIQHDSILRPRDCGGPLVDLDGRIVGINIARAGRVETLALPAPVVRAALTRLLDRD